MLHFPSPQPRISRLASLRAGDWTQVWFGNANTKIFPSNGDVFSWFFILLHTSIFLPKNQQKPPLSVVPDIYLSLLLVSKKRRKNGSDISFSSRSRQSFQTAALKQKATQMLFLLSKWHLANETEDMN